LRYYIYDLTDVLFLDIVMEYAFARSEHRIEQKDFDPSFHDASVAGSTMGAVTKQFPWIFPIMQSMPNRLATWMDPNMASYVNLQKVSLLTYTLFLTYALQGIQEQISQIRNGSNRNWKDASHPTIFHEILESDLPDAEKSTTRLWQDGQITVLAGTLTTAWTLSVAMFHLLFQADVLRKLKTELKSAISQPSSKVSLLTLEQLPYLAACIKESLRLSYGVSSRLQRICPNETLIFNDGKKDWPIPRGTPVGMTCALIHHEPAIFPDSHTFNPERWINQPHLDKYLVSFCKGSRQCLGINLAYAELYLLLARIFRSYGSDKVSFEDDLGYLGLYETTAADVELVADHFIPLPRAGSKGIRVRVMK
jgi:cytochrome P450